METNIFEKASRTKVRFDINGQISTEQLWTVNFDVLVDYEQSLSDLVEGYGKRNRRTNTFRTKDQEVNELRLAIVTHVLNVRESEAKAAADTQETKVHNQRILELIKAKKEAEMASMSVEDLEKLLK